MNVFDPRVFTPPRTLPHPKRHTPVPTFMNIAWTNARPQRNRRARGAKWVGLSYERRVLDVFEAIYGGAFTPSPVIRYDLKRAWHVAIPDGILRIGNTTFIIEIKLTHTERVWEQLMLRYEPLVRSLERREAPTRIIRTIEVCRSYDPSVLLPGPHTVIDSLHRPFGGGILEVLPWKI